jgi:hypothetical protein
VDKTVLTTGSGSEDYLLAAANFGRPFLVYTTDASDTYHVRREIPIVLMQDADLRYFGPQQSGFSDSHSAAAIVFYRQFENWYARVAPIPGGTSTYEIWYEATYEYGSPGDSVGLSAFHHLLRVQTAISALPHCAWRGMSLTENPKAWEMKVKALRDSLVYDEVKYQKEFDSYRAQSSREGVGSKQPYGGWDYDMGSVGGGALSGGYGF